MDVFFRISFLNSYRLEKSYVFISNIRRNPFIFIITVDIVLLIFLKLFI
nr:MAG TPA: hypothetical protein [Caudoviricetes sp.]